MKSVYLAAATSLWGKVNPPPGSNNLGDDPIKALGDLMVTGIRLVLVGAAFLLLAYLFYGGISWITSGGDKEKIEKARNTLTNAIIGIFIVIGSLTVFQVLTGDVLGIIKNTGGGWQIQIPSIGN